MVCHVLSNRVLEMGRYVKRDSDVTVSQEIIGTIVAATVMLGIWGLLVATIKGISKLTKLAENKIKSVSNERTAKKMQKKLERVETLSTALERVGNRLNQTKEINHTVTGNVACLGGSNLKQIQQHLGRDVLAPLEQVLSKTEKQLLAVYEKNSFLENEGSDLDINDEIGPMADALSDFLCKYFKSKPFKQNGLTLIAQQDRFHWDYDHPNTSGYITLQDVDEAAQVLVLAGKLLELHVKFTAIPTSNYAQNETYWLWEVQDMLGHTVRDAINLVARSLNESETKAETVEY